MTVFYLAVSSGVIRILHLGVLLVLVGVRPVPAENLLLGQQRQVVQRRGDIGRHVRAVTLVVRVLSDGLHYRTQVSGKSGHQRVRNGTGKTVRVNLEFSYRFDEARVANTFVTFKGKSGESIKDTFIKPKVIAWTQEVSANYPVTDIFGDKRTAINAELDTYLREKFDQYGIIIDTVNFTDISVDAETAAAIQKKVTAQQELELANIEAQTAKVQAEKEREVALIQAQKDKEAAEIQAETDIIEANAAADVVRIAAEAEAAANQKIAASLTPALIEKIKYEQWNGVTPKVTSSGGSIISMDGLN